MAACIHSDFLTAEHGATFEHGNLPKGVCPLGMLSHTFIHALGLERAQRAYLQNCQMNAAAALAIGLVHEVSVGVYRAQQRAREVAGEPCLELPSGEVRLKAQ